MIGIKRGPLRYLQRSAQHTAHLRLVSSWNKSSLLEASKALQDGKVTAEQLTMQCIDQINKTRHLNMFVRDTFDTAVEKAKDSDARRAQNAALGPLDGIPVALKDNYCTKGVETTAASDMLEGFVPPYESTASSRLAQAGAISLGKLNMDEFAMGSSTTFSRFGATVNPWSKIKNSEKGFVSGGSSGASAAAVASGCCFAALGSDTGGSVRQPAAYCGVVGLKPNYGRISRHGLIAFGSSLDCPGILTRTVGDAALVLRHVAGPDSMDSTSLDESIPHDWCQEKDRKASLEGITVGIPSEYYVQELQGEILDVWQQSIDKLHNLGATIKEVSLPTTKYALAAYYVIACAEASSNLSRYDGVRYGRRAAVGDNALTDNSGGDVSDKLHDLYCRSRMEGFGKEVQRRILSGTFVLSAGAFHDYYEKAVVVRQMIRDDFHRAFEDGVDMFLTPTTPSGPFRIGQKSADPVEMYLNDIMTLPPSLAGLPAMSVPMAVTKEKDGLPLGVQLIGSPKGESDMLHVGQQLEQATNFAQLIPPSIYEP